ncbi:phosphoribosylformylglycinamidine synthase subunit PurQ [Armatimonas sp.]|uniref:phosphoribosylformylglycinamidine synthase subunit PurQ n=1 Tax=Armatimonas sp. TaxID=1872638 RepID=UPI00286AC147|nr:phosphoribosylformylglycinamidine synthase subunit PurQ [Armatimonas sp.]
MSGFTAGVIVFPGSNCDRDAANAWKELGCGEAKLLWHQSTDLQNVDIVIVPGGFSYGDALRAGAIARFAPIMDEVAKFAAGGGLVMGICNGFQILCEAGLLPGALARNEGLKFVCKHVDLRVETTNSPFTSACEKDATLSIPIAHGEGRYVCTPEMHAQLVDEDRILFRYASDNPNGSQDDIAGVLGGPRRNVMGMMPHPERAVRVGLGSADGACMFQSILATLTQAQV